MTDSHVVLRPGEAVLGFTDGATERRNGAEFFGDDLALLVMQSAPRG